MMIIPFCVCHCIRREVSELILTHWMPPNKLKYSYYLPFAGEDLSQPQRGVFLFFPKVTLWASGGVRIWAWCTTRLGLSYLTCEMGILFTLWMCYSHPKPIKHSDPWVGEIPGGGYGNSLQYSCLDNSMDRGVWRTTTHGVAKSWIRLKWLSMHKALSTVFSIQ